MGWFLLMAIVSFFFPPLAVALMTGLSTTFVLNLILTFLGILPGQIHAFYVLFTTL